MAGSSGMHKITTILTFIPHVSTKLCRNHCNALATLLTELTSTHSSLACNLSPLGPQRMLGMPLSASKAQSVQNGPPLMVAFSLSVFADMLFDEYRERIVQQVTLTSALKLETPFASLSRMSWISCWTVSGVSPGTIRRPTETVQAARYNETSSPLLRMDARMDPVPKIGSAGTSDPLRENCFGSRQAREAGHSAWHGSKMG
ncbi:hypothetical protein B0T10DRAFT_148668 [Thelonectria olida]|uniref:Uncharacterized protein n=1 Tax=Thelonectria olida TaxID=1576542 RepID=A0A9P9AHG6_9HYPO|nr:hypothetical protein B0T10DRAFT_148668 [Thelonectria olida]